jgi:hypothetical protein
MDNTSAICPQRLRRNAARPKAQNPNATEVGSGTATSSTRTLSSNIPDVLLVISDWKLIVLEDPGWATKSKDLVSQVSASGRVEPL